MNGKGKTVPETDNHALLLERTEHRYHSRASPRLVTQDAHRVRHVFGQAATSNLTVADRSIEC